MLRYGFVVCLVGIVAAAATQRQTSAADEPVTFSKHVLPILQKHGGKFLARTQSHELIEGANPHPGLIAILEWPSKEAAEAFYADPDYQPHLQARLAGATNTWHSVEGKDDFAPA